MASAEHKKSVEGLCDSDDKLALLNLVDKDLEWFETVIQNYHEKKQKEKLSLKPNPDDFSRLLKQEIEDEMQEVVRKTFGKYLVSDPLREELVDAPEPNRLREFWIQLDFAKDFSSVYRDSLNTVLQNLQNRLEKNIHDFSVQAEGHSTTQKENEHRLSTPTSSIKNKKRKNSTSGSGTSGSSEKRVSFSPKPYIHKATGLPCVDV